MSFCGLVPWMTRPPGSYSECLPSVICFPFWKWLTTDFFKTSSQSQAADIFLKPMDDNFTLTAWLSVLYFSVLPCDGAAVTCPGRTMTLA